MAPKDTNKLSGTQLIHADDELHGPEVAPSISVSTSQSSKPFPCMVLHTDIPLIAFRALDPTKFPKQEFDEWNPKQHVYSRYTQNVSTRAERVLSKINVCPPPPPFSEPRRSTFQCRAVMPLHMLLGSPHPMPSVTLIILSGMFGVD